MTKQLSRPSAGSGLLAVLFCMAVVTLSVALIYGTTNNQISMTRRTANRTVASAYADGVMESLYEQWRSAMIGVTNTADRLGGLSTSALAATLTPPSGTVLPPPSGTTLASWSVVASTPLLAPTTNSSGRPTPENGTASSLRVRLYYLATVTVNYATAGGNTAAVTIQRPFVRSGRNLFDNFLFSLQPKTEIHPGPAMYLSGTVYVGGDLYTAHDTLHFTKDVSLTGTHSLNYRPEDPRYGAMTPTIASTAPGTNWDINNPPHYGSQQKLFDTPLNSLDSNFLDDPRSNDTDSDGNLNNDGFHEIIEEKSGSGADPLQLDSSTSERLVTNADYRIYVDALNNVTIYKGAATTALVPTNVEYLAIRNAVTTNRALRDVREGDNVRVVALDVGRVRTAYNTSIISDNAGSGDGLLFYVKDTSVGIAVPSNIVDSSSGASTSVTSSRQRGVKLMNGAQLPGSGVTGLAAGFSVVTPNSVYIQGDYNTGASGSIQPPSNTATSYTPPADNPNPYVTGYNRVPAAVVGDAVNVLSNNWNDANSMNSRAARPATNTTINTAIVSGNVPTTSASYSGGVENFTRFHEEWTGDYFTLYGAIAILFNSEQATGPVSAADYGAPARRLYYDTLLQDNNPPGFRVARTYERGPWTTH